MTTKTKIASFDVQDHGPEHAQFFQGCGTAFTKFDHVVTGRGDSQQGAYADALDQIAMGGVDVTELEAYGKARYNDETCHENIENDETGEWGYYLSIRYTLKD